MGTPMTSNGNIHWSDISQGLAAAREGKEAIYVDLFRKRIQEATDQSLVLMDYGTCDGGNVLPFFQKLLGSARNDKIDREVTLVFNDQSGNDYNVLAKKITGCKEIFDDPNTHIMMNIGNVYKRCMPKESVDCGYCLYVVMWLSSKCEIREGLFWTDCSAEERDTISNQAAMDWKQFLLCRAEELKPGGLMIIDIPGQPRFPLEICKETFRELFQKGFVSKDEYTNTAVATYLGRDIDDLRRPFDELGETWDMELLDITVRTVNVHERELSSLGRLAGYIRSWMFLSIMEGLDDTRTEEDKKQICEMFFQHLDDKIKTRKIESLGTDVFVVTVKKKL